MTERRPSLATLADADVDIAVTPQVLLGRPTREALINAPEAPLRRSDAIAQRLPRGQHQPERELTDRFGIVLLIVCLALLLLAER